MTSLKRKKATIFAEVAGVGVSIVVFLFFLEINHIISSGTFGFASLFVTAMGLIIQAELLRRAEKHDSVQSKECV